MERLYNGVFRIDRPCMANVRRIDQGCLPMVLEMNRRGFRADGAKLRSLGAEFQNEYVQLVDRLESLAGWRCNPCSGDQVARLLFDELGLEPSGEPRMTKSRSRMSTDDEMLSSLLGRHEAVQVIRDARELAKLKGTYCDALPAHIRPDGRVRTTLKMYTARTGRLSSEEPNLQNIPVKSEVGRRIRSAFVASPGTVLSSIDLSQIEMVWAAELSGDSVMREVYSAGQDLHVRTACALFRLDYDEVAPQWARYKRGESASAGERASMRDFETYKRLPAKTLGFAVLYGVTPTGLQTQILAAGGPLFTVEECEEYIRRWFSLFSGVRDWMELQYSRVRRYGMTWTAFGRPRNIPEIFSAVQSVRNKGLRQAGNTPIQGTAGDHLKLAMAQILDEPVHYYRSLGRTCDPLLQIHDELIFELSPEIADEFNDWAGYLMCSAVRPMNVVVKSSATVADNWGDLK